MMLALIAAATQAPATDPSPYAEGQVWEYRTRPSDEGSLLRIQRIEDHPAFAARGPVYHISVIGVRLGGQSEAGAIQHLPVARATLEASVTRLSVRDAPFPDPAEGMAQWRQAEGGVFDIPLAQIIDLAEQAIRQGNAEPQP